MIGTVKPKPQLVGPPQPCDCTCICGDDPWLVDGRSVPCERKAKKNAELRAWLARPRVVQVWHHKFGRQFVIELDREITEVEAAQLGVRLASV